MTIHLVKSDDVDIELFSQVFELLESVPGPICFKHTHQFSVEMDDLKLKKKIVRNKKQFEKTLDLPDLSNKNMLISDRELSFNYIPPEFPHERKVATWEQLFNKAQDYRKRHKIPNEELVILLTKTPNENNWFATLDPRNPINGFIHCDDWPYYIQCPSQFPIAYEVVALSLRRNLYHFPKDLMKLVHHRPKGCLNDFCENKPDIELKLRTGDICNDCMSELVKFQIPRTDINHGLDLFARFRERMLYAKNMQRNKPVSPLVITKHNKLFLPEYDNIEIKFTPLEKTLYYLFLKHPDGILMSDLYMYRKELENIYLAIYSRGGLDEMLQSIHDMSNATKNSASEKISSIKRKFIDAIGEN
ncbi:MAG: hypothetical protein FGM54_09355, partial [Chitinophagaceae bacterium]|nr:hypothetical protein [Chitinophagaceae bacterium]